MQQLILSHQSFSRLRYIAWREKNSFSFVKAGKSILPKRVMNPFGKRTFPLSRDLSPSLPFVYTRLYTRRRNISVCHAALPTLFRKSQPDILAEASSAKTMRTSSSCSMTLNSSISKISTNIYIYSGSGGVEFTR